MLKSVRRRASVFQPVLAVGVDPVEFPVPVGRVVRVHVVHAVIFGERPAEFRPQRLVRGVGQPEGVHPFLPETDAEEVIVRRKMRGETDEVHQIIVAVDGRTVKWSRRSGILVR